LRLKLVNYTGAETLLSQKLEMSQFFFWQVLSFRCQTLTLEKNMKWTNRLPRNLKLSSTAKLGEELHTLSML